MNDIGIRDEANESRENSKQSKVNLILDNGAGGGGGTNEGVSVETEVRSGSLSVLAVEEVALITGGWSISESEYQD